MPRIKERQRIFDVVRSIAQDEFRLPSIQRSFVWEEERICKLMDSIMNDYPIGSFLVWSPPTNMLVRTRKFIQDYKEGMRLISEEPAVQSSRHLVLDGQQRLQSLYLGFFGKYQDKHLYFKTESNPETEENDLRYVFRFLKQEDASKDSHLIGLDEIVKLNTEDIPEFVTERFKEDQEEIRKRITRNLTKFIRVFNIDEKIPFQEIKEDMPHNDVLEVFVRVNSGGVILTKSDLVFSTLVLAIPEMEREFIELVDDLNGGGEFDFDIDFLSKASFVVFDKGAKYDLKKLEDKGYIDNLKNRFEEFKNAATSTMEFLKTEAKILSKRFLKSDLALIPVIDFIMRQPKQQLQSGQAAPLRQYLYMSFFMRFYSYGADAKLDFIHQLIKDHPASEFPVGDIGDYMVDKTSMPYDFTKFMLTDLDLVLNIIQGGVYEIPKKKGWSLERDHIFPRSLLETANVPEDLRDNIGNLRLINKVRNIRKSDNLPEESTEFFGSSDLELKPLFLQARGNLNLDNFKPFVQKREDLIFNKVRAFLQFEQQDSSSASQPAS
jgi:uncharacterized protein with ParB-like and HNH nuclease domain